MIKALTQKAGSFGKSTLKTIYRGTIHESDAILIKTENSGVEPYYHLQSDWQLFYHTDQLQTATFLINNSLI